MEDVYKKIISENDLEIISLGDDKQRYLIDSYPKLYWIVNERFKEQKKKNPDAEPVIDLSNVVIYLDNALCTFWIGKLCGEISGIINLGGETDNIPIKEGIFFDVKYEISFKNSIIYSMQLRNTRFLKSVNFQHTCFFGITNISDSIFIENVDLLQIDINQNIKRNDKLPVINGNIYFQSLIFKKDVYFELENWNNSLYFHVIHNTYEGNVCFRYCSIIESTERYYDFTNSNFKGNVLIDSRINSGIGSLISQMNFSGSHFHKKLKIVGVQIGNILMQNCHFDNTVNISLNKYDDLSNIDFSFSTINSLFFIDSDLGDDKGEPIKLEKEISFSKSLITKDAFVFLRNINRGGSYNREGTLNFEYANILGTITIQDSKLKLIKLDKSTLIGDINIENVETDYDSRESIVKVKNSYLKRNDVVNSLAYKAKEMKYYSEHLNFKSPYINKVLGWSKKNRVYNMLAFCILLLLLLLALLYLFFGILFDRHRKCTEGEDTEKEENMEKHVQGKDTLEEYVLLNLNRISNSFGMSWIRGVIFTCIIACAFFILINTVGIKSSPLFVWGWNGWDGFGDVWKYYLNMFYLLDFKEKFKDLLTGKSIELNALGDTLFFVSKIFVSYGIYQTISAFRKYGK